MEQGSALAEVRERVRPEMERALSRARRELEGINRRRQELLGEIERAEAWLGVDDDRSGPDVEVPNGKMTLHGAMEAIIREWGPTRITKLADEIDQRGLYKRRDGRPAGAHQIHARVHNYPDRFVRVSPGVVGLRK